MNSVRRREGAIGAKRCRTMATEYQKIHGYITDRFPKVNSAADLERYQLSPAQISQYHEQGFLTGIRILEAGQVDELARRLELIRKGLDQHMERLYEVEAAYLGPSG